MDYVVYILRSLRTGRYYCGHTQDLFRRFLEHGRGKSRSTRSGVPWALVWWEYHRSRSEAVRREQEIKSRGIARFLQEQGMEQ
ncbi:MAG: GIY-YIG nuclease family protein [Calditrichaeota bacterium]|nr:MAG: GIY-YIG nuclease family protein [Calditrichota bacterium]